MADQNESDNGSENPSPEKDMNSDADAARREVLKRLGLFSAYTAPSLLAMLYSQKAAAAAVDSTSTC
jgi:hypothetical protein